MTNSHNYEKFKLTNQSHRDFPPCYAASSPRCPRSGSAAASPPGRRGAPSTRGRFGLLAAALAFT
eukprot:1378489-Amorphochlora_amoeboformis.AAC.1